MWTSSIVLSLGFGIAKVQLKYIYGNLPLVERRPGERTMRNGHARMISGRRVITSHASSCIIQVALENIAKVCSSLNYSGNVFCFC